MPIQQEQVAVVTGASGYLATHIIKKLLERGYVTRGTVRNLADPKVKQLRELFPKLELYEAELTKPGSYDKVIKGATYVFHAASPVFFTAEDTLRDIVEPAVNGTKTVLESATKAGTVKRVVYTSSIAAVLDTQFAKTNPDHVFSDKDWNLYSTHTNEPYRYSKRLAEEWAWNYVKEHKGFDLISINPSFIIGPPLKKDDGVSVQKVKAFFEGKSDASMFGMIDVRDVAEAHIRAAENPNANGRYLLSSDAVIPNIELSKTLVQTGRYTQYNLPTTSEFPSPDHLSKFDTSKTQKELGIERIPLEKSLVDMVEALLDLGIIPRK